MLMVYCEILLNAKPWTGDARLVGLLAEDPKTGKVRLARTKLSDVDAREAAANERFLASLEALVKLQNAAPGQHRVSAIVKQVPDRGTAFRFSGLRSGEFATVASALRQCVNSRNGAVPVRQNVTVSLPAVVPG